MADDERFQEHAQFSVGAPEVAAQLDALLVPTSGSRRRRRTHLSAGAADKQFLQMGAMLNELTAAQRDAAVKDENLQTAAEIGQMLLEKNARTEEVAADLQQTVQTLTSDLADLEQQNAKLRHHIEELGHANMQLVQLDPSAAAAAQDDLDDELTLTEFLRLELENGHDEPTGNALADLAVFRRNLHRERKQGALRQGVFEETLESLREQRQDAIDKLAKFRERVEAHAQLAEENIRLQKELDELNEKMRAQNIEHLAAMRRKRQAVQSAVDMEAKSMSDIQAMRNELAGVKEEQLRERAEAAARVGELTDQVSALRDSEARLQREVDELKQRALDLEQAQRARRDDDKSADRALEETRNRAESTVADLAELRRRFDAERRDLQHRLRLAEEEQETVRQRAQALEIELRRSEGHNAELLKKLAQFKELGMNLRASIDEDKARARAAAEALEKDRRRAAATERKLALLAQQLEEARQKAALGRDATRELKAERERLRDLEAQKAALEVKLMVLRKQDEGRAAQLREREAELKKLKLKAAQLARDRADLETRWRDAEKKDLRGEELGQIASRLQELMQKYSSKEQENESLMAELERLRKVLQQVAEAKSAKAKYKEMGKKMIVAMKQMDQEMKELVVKYENAQRELAAEQRKNQKLERRNDELAKEVQTTEVQMNKLMRICITGTTAE